MEKRLINHGWVRSLVYLTTLIPVMLLFGIPAMELIAFISGMPPGEFSRLSSENIHLLLIYQTILLTGVTGLTLVFRKYVDVKGLLSLGFQKFRRNKDMILGLVVGFSLIATGFLIMFLTGNLSVETINPDAGYLAGSLILCLMISWIEELSFRSYILNNLLDSFHPYIALLVSSFLFAVFHMFNPGMSLLPFINLMLAGILLGIVFIYTKTVWFALSLHFSWNFFQGPVFGFPVSGIETESLLGQRPPETNIITGGDFGFEGSLICTALLITGIFVIDRYYNKTGINTFDKNN
jgi:uncharacterized protein